MPFSTLKCEECKELAFHMRLGRRLYHILMLVAVQQKQKQGFSPCNIWGCAGDTCVCSPEIQLQEYQCLLWGGVGARFITCSSWSLSFVTSPSFEVHIYKLEEILSPELWEWEPGPWKPYQAMLGYSSIMGQFKRQSHTEEHKKIYSIR